MRELGYTIVLLCATITLAEVPSYIKVCGRRNPNLNKCVIDSVASLKPKLVEGVKELDVPTMEPLFMSKVALAELRDFKAFARNVSLFGLSNYNIKSLEVGLDKKQMEIDLSFAEVRLTADYDVNAKILVPISGRGPIDIISYDVRAKVVMKYKLVNHKGNDYMYFYAMTTKLTIKDYTANFAPKDGPESALATAINTALASNRQEFIEGTIPNLEKTISENVLIIANKICKHFTYDELFPDRE